MAMNLQYIVSYLKDVLVREPGMLVRAYSVRGSRRRGTVLWAGALTLAGRVRWCFAPMGVCRMAACSTA